MKAYFALILSCLLGSKSFVQRLQRDHTLSGHSGCVSIISRSFLDVAERYLITHHYYQHFPAINYVLISYNIKTSRLGNATGFYVRLISDQFIFLDENLPTMCHITWTGKIYFRQSQRHLSLLYIMEVKLWKQYSQIQILFLWHLGVHYIFFISRIKQDIQSVILEEPKQEEIKITLRINKNKQLWIFIDITKNLFGLYAKNYIYSNTD